MRTFELLIAVTELAYLLWLSFGSGLPASRFRWLPFVAAGLLLVHLFAEGARWQLAPLYLLVILTLAAYPLCQTRSFRLRLRHMCIGWAVAGTLLGTTLVTGGVLWPVFEFVPLTGPYKVGTISEYLVIPAPATRTRPANRSIGS